MAPTSDGADEQGKGATPVTTDEPTQGSYPPDLRYTAEHEWVGSADDEGAVRVGVTDYAQAALGDIVFVSLPAVGDEVTAGAACGELESTKSVSDIYAPIDGVVVARNEALDVNPELVNADAYGEGWLFTVRPADPAARESLLDDSGYRAVVGEG
jgi:glycine cleavage system H protein